MDPQFFNNHKNGTQGAFVGVSGVRLFQERVLGPSGKPECLSCGATWQISGVILDPVGFWRGPPNRQLFKQIENIRKMRPKKRVEQIRFVMDLWCQNGRPEIVKKMFPHYIFCKLGDSGGQENESKKGCHKSAKMNQMEAFGDLGFDLWDFGKLSNI